MFRKTTTRITKKILHIDKEIWLSDISSSFCHIEPSIYYLEYTGESLEVAVFKLPLYFHSGFGLFIRKIFQVFLLPGKAGKSQVPGQEKNSLYIQAI